MDRINKRSDSKIRYSSKFNNRDIVATVCRNELNDLINYCEASGLIDSEEYIRLNYLLQEANRQTHTNMPMKLQPYCITGKLKKLLDKQSSDITTLLALLTEESQPWMWENDEIVLLENQDNYITSSRSSIIGGKKISEVPTRTEIEGSEYIPFQDGSLNARIGLSTLIEHITENVKPTDTLTRERFMELLKTCIDNDTILYNETEDYIYAKGGGSTTTFSTITLGVNPTDISKLDSITADNAYNTTISEDGLTYVFKCFSGDDITISIKTKPGYVVQRLNVDKVGQGSIDTYTFLSISEDHTMYLWLQEEVQANPIQWVKRSDNNQLYDSYQAAVDSIMSDYPQKLTLDIILSCVKNNIDFKITSGLFVVTIENYNQDSLYTLTFDGNNECTINCGSLGGFAVEYSDNIIIQNMNIINVSNFIESNAPEEFAAVYVRGNVERMVRNVYILNCNISGRHPTSDGANGRSAIIGQYAENLYILNNNIDQFNTIVLKMLDCRIVSIIKNHIVATNSYGIIGHPSLCTYNNGTYLISEDNDYSGDTGEYLFSLTNVDVIRFNRDYFHDIGGEGVKVFSKTPVKEFSVESCLFVNLLSRPVVAWAFTYIIFDCDVRKLRCINNTAYINSNWWQQWFMRGQNLNQDEVYLYNNIFITAVSSDIPMRGISLGYIGELHSGNNLYSVPLNSSGNPLNGYFSSNNITGNISTLLQNGYEIGSNIVSNTTKLLPYLNGGTSFALMDILKDTYPANTTYYSDIDLEYKMRNPSKNNVGAINNYGTLINETTDSTLGYNGEDYTETTDFNNSVTFDTFADNILYLKHNTSDRTKFIKIKFIGNQHQSLSLGKHSCVSLLPNLDTDNEYISDELYNVIID